MSHLKRHKLIHDKPKVKKILKCDKCDFIGESQYKLTRHTLNTKHKASSQATKYCRKKSLRDGLRIKLLKKVCPEKVFGEDEVKQLVEDCDGSIREIIKVLKWVRKCFGKKKFTPHIRDIMKKYLSRFDHLHEAEIETFIDKNGEDKVSVIARVADINLFVQEATKERGLSWVFSQSSDKKLSLPK